MFAVVSRHITKRGVQIALGILWVFDGLLQLQPQMFTNKFALDVIAPAGVGEPGFIHGPIHLLVQMILHQTVVWDIFFATVQLAIGLFILNKKTVRVGLIASVIWGLMVWYIGEGMGGIVSGQAMLLTGAPGAALLYALISLAVLPSVKGNKPASWLAYVWAAVWMGGGLLMLWSKAEPQDIASMVSSMGSSAPGWLQTIDQHASNWISGVPTWTVLLFVCCDFLIGLGVLLPPYMRYTAIGVGIVLSCAFWLFGQDFGMLYSGLATDPNTAPLVILLGLAVLGAPEVRLHLT